MFCIASIFSIYLALTKMMEAQAIRVEDDEVPGPPTISGSDAKDHHPWPRSEAS
jgi:hypothetical protein